jgi:PAS domain S-box-containing protein
MSISVVLGVVLLFGALGYLGLAAFVWRHRQAAGGEALTVALLAVGTWTICYALELSSTTVAVARFWSGAKFLGIVVLAPAMWVFVFRYTGRGALPGWLFAILLVEPVAVLVLLTLPATHDLVHYYPADPTRQRFLGHAPIPESGPLFWSHAVYTYVVLLGAVAVLVYRLARVAALYRRSGLVMISVTVLPFLGNLLFNTETAQVRVDPTPFLFSITVAVLVWGFFRMRLLDLLPVARSVVLERMADGVVVVDAYRRLVDANRAAESLLGGARGDLVGRPLVELAPAVDAVLAAHAPGTTSRGEVLARRPGRDSADDLAVTVTDITDGAGRNTAHVVLLRDVSERRRTERRLRDLLQEQTHLAEILQQSLRPRTLPEVPGYDLAVRSVPAGRQGQVSGDFYDVHPAGDGRWGLVLGDVSGKGVGAAVVTAMARYTVRALSAQGSSPSVVLDQLNSALLSDDVERFCTVVYAHLDPSGLRMSVALGGHPRPLLRRRDGRVELVGEHGTALGMIPEIEVREVTVDLEPGDVVLAYTDGVTEARAGGVGEEFGESRLVEVLRRAGPGAEDVAEAVMAAVEAFSASRDDDVAVFVLRAGRDRLRTVREGS